MDYEQQFLDAEKEGKTERITALRFVFKEGDVLVGMYLGRDLITGKKKGMSDSYSYRFDAKDGPVTCFISSAFDKAHGESMIEGAIYKITYKGKQQISGSRTFKIFDVRRAPGPLEPPEADADVE
jgi:hypothetical protein